MRPGLHPRQTQPETQNGSQQRENDWLKDLHSLGLSDGSDGKGEDGGAYSAKGGSEANGANVKVFREELGGRDLFFFLVNLWF